MIEEAILDSFSAERGDWRTWNLSRSHAGHLAETYAAPDHSASSLIQVER